MRGAGIVNIRVTVFRVRGVDDRRQLTSRTFGNSTSQSYSYDAISRLSELDIFGSGTGTTINFNGYNPANEIGSRVVGNNSYSWIGAVSGTVSFTPDGVNKYSAISGTSVGYDDKSDMTTLGTAILSFGAEGTVTTSNIGSGTSMWHDALDRLTFITRTSQRFDYDGDQLAGLYVDSGSSGVTLTRRYVYEPGANAPIVWYEGTGTSDRRYLDADDEGSIVRVTDTTGGTTLAINSYNEYGVPGANNLGRFQYAGYIWLPETAMYLTRNRIYSQGIGRFLQPDPAGYGGGINLYGYTGNNPVNFSDPLGLEGPGPVAPNAISDDCSSPDCLITVTATKTKSFTIKTPLPPSVRIVVSNPNRNLGSGSGNRGRGQPSRAPCSPNANQLGSGPINGIPLSAGM